MALNIIIIILILTGYIFNWIRFEAAVILLLTIISLRILTKKEKKYYVKRNIR